ncbi:hypothetical protein DOY81_005657 [Sarcophaga bullata]|nr:hypothetical protein DOY81_005657 [Sarcophaga bullata]
MSNVLWHVCCCLLVLLLIANNFAKDAKKRKDHHWQRRNTIILKGISINDSKNILSRWQKAKNIRKIKTKSNTKSLNYQPTLNCQPKNIKKRENFFIERQTKSQLKNKTL